MNKVDLAEKVIYDKDQVLRITGILAEFQSSIEALNKYSVSNAVRETHFLQKDIKNGGLDEVDGTVLSQYLEIVQKGIKEFNGKVNEFQRDISEFI